MRQHHRHPVARELVLDPDAVQLDALHPAMVALWNCANKEPRAGDRYRMLLMTDIAVSWRTLATSLSSAAISACR